MRFRRARPVPLLLALGCQDKKPAGPAAATESPAAAETTATARPDPGRPAPAAARRDHGREALPPGRGVRGRTPGRARPGLPPAPRTRPSPSIRILTLPVPEGEKLEGREWTFGGKVDDPLVC